MNTSYIKKNKNLLNRIVSELKRSYEASKVGYINKSIDVEISGEFYTYSTVLGVIFYMRDLNIFEEKDKVYIGINLDKCTYDIESDDDLGRSITTWIKNKISPWRGEPDEHLKSLAEKEEITKANTMSYTGCKDFSVVKTIMKAVKEELNSKPDVILKDGEWPKLSNRKILPIVVIDKSTGDFDYHKGMYRMPSSYRASRRKSNIFIINKDYIRYIVDGRVPFSLVDMDSK